MIIIFLITSCHPHITAHLHIFAPPSLISSAAVFPKTNAYHLISNDSVIILCVTPRHYFPHSKHKQ